MNREEKVTEVAALQARFRRAKVALITHATGLDVATVMKLRRELKRAGGEFKIAKNTLTRLALKDTEFAKLEELLSGPTGLVFGYEDPVAVTKVLVDFAKDHDKVSIRAGVIERNLLEPAEVDQLAKMPSKEVVLAQLLAVMQAPATNLVRLLQEPGARMARVLDAVRSRLEGNA